MKDINTTEWSMPFGFLDGDKVNYLVRIGDGNDTNYAVYTESLDGRSSPFLVPHDSYEEALATVLPPSKEVSTPIEPIEQPTQPPKYTMLYQSIDTNTAIFLSSCG